MLLHNQGPGEVDRRTDIPLKETVFLGQHMTNTIE